MADSLLLAAVKQNDFKAVRERLEEGDDVDGKWDEGTPLWWAAYNGNARIATLLFEHGADLSAKYNNMTPKDIAVKNERTAVVTILRGAQQPRKPFESETWVPMSANAVALVGHYPALDRRLTHIFNFELRERLLISENLKNKTEDVADRTSFDALPAPALDRALDEFRRLGGTADRDYVLEGPNALGKNRKLTAPEAGNG